MRLHNLEVRFHRTVRVAEGRAASNLPPSLGHMKLHKVADYRKNCPEDWADDAYFMSLHDTEAMWISFHSANGPCAVLVGAGGVNALTGQKLGTKLEKGNYLVCPPQPWLDGWKSTDGSVHQFVATPHKKGEGVTVAEQIIGKESKTGAMGLAVFYPKDGAKLKTAPFPTQGFAMDGNSTVMAWGGPVCVPQAVGFSMDFCDSSLSSKGICSTANMGEMKMESPVKKRISTAGGSSVRFARPHVEMGLGKGGKIIQKVYEDPHGIEVWQEKPTVVFAFYLVDAKTAEEITGEKVAAPATHEAYQGPWYGLKDADKPDVIGTSIFDSLKSATSAFPGDTSNVTDQAEVADEPVAVADKTGA